MIISLLLNATVKPENVSYYDMSQDQKYWDTPACVGRIINFNNLYVDQDYKNPNIQQIIIDSKYNGDLEIDLPIFIEGILKEKPKTNLLRIKFRSPADFWNSDVYQIKEEELKKIVNLTLQNIENKSLDLINQEKL